MRPPLNDPDPVHRHAVRLLGPKRHGDRDHEYHGHAEAAVVPQHRVRPHVDEQDDGERRQEQELQQPNSRTTEQPKNGEQIKRQRDRETEREGGRER